MLKGMKHAMPQQPINIRGYSILRQDKARGDAPDLMLYSLRYPCRDLLDL